MGKPNIWSRKIMHTFSPSAMTAQKMLRRLSCLLLVTSFVLLAACAGKKPTEDIAPSMPAVQRDESPQYFVSQLRVQDQGMRSFRELAPTIDKSLDYLKRKKSSDYAIRRPGLTMTWGEMKRTLIRLKQLLPSLDANPSLFTENFEWVRVNPYISYSGYYSPVVKASTTRKPGYTLAFTAGPRILANTKVPIIRAERLKKKGNWPIAVWSWPGRQTP